MVGMDQSHNQEFESLPARHFLLKIQQLRGGKSYPACGV